MKKNKIIIRKLVNVVASFAMVFSVVAVNTRCVCIFHQPKMPEKLKQLKKD